MIVFSRADARRIAVRAQLLDARRPADLLDMVRDLTLLQIDPAAAIAPSADVVAWSRLGSGYSPADLVAALRSRSLVELHSMIRPGEDMALYRAEMAAWPGAGELRDWQRGRAGWVEANDGCRADILARLRTGGPLTSRELPDTCAVPWTSTGWTNNQNVTKLLDFMVARGEVAVAGRKGRERLWDLADRVYPSGPFVPFADAARLRAERRLAALGIARACTTQYPTEPADVGEVGEEAVVEGVKGTWRVDAELLDGARFQGRTALLSPLDRLVFDRVRLRELFEFDYQLEMYKPAARRKWGYWALPILHGDRLIGKLDATADRQAGMLRIDAVHEDVPFIRPIAAAVDREIGDLAEWLALEPVRTGR